MGRHIHDSERFCYFNDGINMKTFHTILEFIIWGCISFTITSLLFLNEEFVAFAAAPIDPVAIAEDDYSNIHWLTWLLMDGNLWVINISVLSIGVLCLLIRICFSRIGRKIQLYIFRSALTKAIIDKVLSDGDINAIKKFVKYCSTRSEKNNLKLRPKRSQETFRRKSNIFFASLNISLLSFLFTYQLGPDNPVLDNGFNQLVSKQSNDAPKPIPNREKDSAWRGYKYSTSIQSGSGPSWEEHLQYSSPKGSTIDASVTVESTADNCFTSFLKINNNMYSQEAFEGKKVCIKAGERKIISLHQQVDTEVINFKFSFRVDNSNSSDKLFFGEGRVVLGIVGNERQIHYLTHEVFCTPNKDGTFYFYSEKEGLKNSDVSCF